MWVINCVEYLVDRNMILICLNTKKTIATKDNDKIVCIYVRYILDKVSHIADETSWGYALA